MNLRTDISAPLTDEQLQVIIGTVLGDASITKSRNKRETACIRFCHSIHQKEYIWYKYQFLKSLSNRSPKNYTNWNKGKQQYYTKIDFSSIYTKELYNLYKLFYVNGKKIIPKNIATYLTPLSLSIWYMDDGSIETIRDKRNGKIHYIRNRINLHTNCFPECEQKILLNAIFQKFGIKFSIKKVEKGKHFILYLRSRKSIEKFISIIKPYIIPSMMYKIKLSYIKKMKKLYSDNDLIRIVKKLKLKSRKDYIKYRKGKLLYYKVCDHFGSIKNCYYLTGL